MENRKMLNKLIIMALCIILTIVAMVTVTFALFTDSVTSSNHLQAGTLKAGFNRTSMTGVQLGSDGRLVRFTDNTVVNLASSSEQAFDLGQVCPGANVTSQFEITNNGSIAFTYEVRLINATVLRYDAATSQYVDVVTPSAYLKQIQVTFIYGTGDAAQNLVFALSDYAKVDSSGKTSNALYINDEVAASGTSAFTAKIRVLNDTTASFDNNILQGALIAFDIQVIATQVSTVRG